MNDQAVLIGAGDQLPGLKARAASEARDILTFTDAEALRALEVITTRRPRLVLLEHKFAATPRGAALVNRIKADPSLAETQIRLVALEASAAAAPAAVAAAAASAMPSEPAPAPANAPARSRASEAMPADAKSPHLDYRGTRRVARVRVAESLEMLVDGSRGDVVDLSPLGAQLLTSSVLRPNQRVRVSLTDEERTIRCGATVVWALFEIPKGSSPRYRVGVEFIEPDAAALEACAQRHARS